MTLVRSPTNSGRLSSVGAIASTPLTAGAGAAAGTRGRRVRASAAMAAMWAGVVPQQPPTMLTQPSSRKRRSL